MLSAKSRIRNNLYLYDENRGQIQTEYLTRTAAVGLAHEIRNPLTTVKGLIQLIKPHLAEIGKEQYADLALEEINRANDLLFDFMSSEKPKLALKSELSLNKLLQDIAIVYECEGSLNNIQFTVQLLDENLNVLANEKQLRQVLGNMIKNSIEAILICREENNRQITISLSKHNSAALILIEDNGFGMSAETMEQIFTPFYSTKQSGTGIGLSICKKIIEDHDGDLEIKSSTINGTAFILKLPLK